MKWFALLIFLSAAAAGTYVLTQGDSKTSKSKEKISQDFPPDDPDDKDEEEAVPTSGAKVGAAEEIILPPSEDAAEKEDPEGVKTAGDIPGEREPRKRKRKKGPPTDPAQAQNEAPPQERAAPAPVAQNTYRPIVAPALPPQQAEAPAPQAASSPGASGVLGSGLGNGPLMGGVATPVGSAAGSKPPSSSSKPRSGTFAAAPAQADKKPPTPEEAQVLPIKHAPPTPPPPSEDSKEKSGVTEKAPVDNADFVGLLISPKSVGVTGPNDVEKKMIAVYSMKSGFGPQDKLAVEIFRDCEAPSIVATVPFCDTAAPEGGPSISGYLMGAVLSKEDLLPNSNTLDIGTTVVGTYQEPDTGKEMPLAEVALQIDPGRVPGHYLIRVRSPNDKSFQGAFEVTAPSKTAP